MGWLQSPIALSHASSSSAIVRQPLLPSNRKNKRGKSAKNRFLLDLHSVFLCDAARRRIIGMNKRNHALQFQITKGMTPHRSCGFGRESPAPIIRIESISNFDFFCSIDLLSSKFAPRVLATVHPSSLLRQPDEESREREYRRFVVDLRAALKAAGEE